MILFLLSCAYTADQYADDLIDAKCAASERCYDDWDQAKSATANCDKLAQAATITVCRDDHFDAENAVACLDHWRDLVCDDEAETLGEGDASCDATCVAPVDGDS